MKKTKGQQVIMKIITSSCIFSLFTSTSLAYEPFTYSQDGSVDKQTDVNHTCVLEKPILSCSNEADATGVDSCCTETFGGLVLATQFWNTWTGREAEGQKLPKDSWTIHGLWPDFCDGSYTQYCDLDRQYDPEPFPNTTNGEPDGDIVPPYDGPSIKSFLEPFGKYDLLDYMNTFWVNKEQPNAVLWAHEFSKHATCFSTFDVPCYGPLYQLHEDVVDYFETAIAFDRQLPTWGWLAEHDIIPSNYTTYNLADIQKSLKEQYGAFPYIGCSGPKYNETEGPESNGHGSADDGRTVLSEVWYFSHILGRPQDANFVPVDAKDSGTNCAIAEGAIRYPERAPGSVTYQPRERNISLRQNYLVI